MARPIFSAAALLAFLTLGARSARAQPGDQQARKLERQAIDFHYLGMQFKEAEKVLSSAVDLCETKTCSESVRAHLYISLGFVRGAGKGDLEQAREQFIRGLRIDPEIKLTGTLATPRLMPVFEEAREATKSFRTAHASDYRPGVAMGDPVVPREEETTIGEDQPSAPTPQPPPDSGEARNHLELSFTPDLGFISAKDVCTPPAAGTTSQWVCVDEAGSPYTGRPQPNLDNNNVKFGVALSTIRLVAGYRRALSDRWEAGLRVGFAMRGGPTPPGGTGFLPLHAEGRVIYRPSARRTEPMKLNPFFLAAGGLMEVDTNVPVNVVEVPCTTSPAARCARHLSAWYRAGFGFLGLGGGLEMPLGQSQSLVFATRLSLTLGSTEVVLSPELGYEQRF
jgi:hypothetical protein